MGSSNYSRRETDGPLDFYSHRKLTPPHSDHVKYNDTTPLGSRSDFVNEDSRVIPLSDGDIDLQNRLDEEILDRSFHRMFPGN